MRLLIVEDEAVLAQQLAGRLRALAHHVDVACDGLEGRYYGCEYAYDLAIIDLGLPKLDGITLIRSLRAADRRYPVLILTARDRWQTKVEALEAGADDYLVKPFAMEELEARIKALIRRAGGWAQSRLSLGPLRMDLDAREVILDGTRLELTRYEYQIIECLLLNPQRPVSKAELMEKLYADDELRDDNVIEVFIARLRRKLGAVSDAIVIETLRGHGYRIACPSDTA